MDGIRLVGVLGGGQSPKVDESSAEMPRPLGGELHSQKLDINSQVIRNWWTQINSPKADIM